MVIMVFHNLLWGSKLSQNSVAWDNNPSIVLVESLSQELRQGIAGMPWVCLLTCVASAGGKLNIWSNDHLGLQAPFPRGMVYQLGGDGGEAAFRWDCWPVYLSMLAPGRWDFFQGASGFQWTRWRLMSFWASFGSCSTVLYGLKQWQAHPDSRRGDITPPLRNVKEFGAKF